ncbi:MAG: HAD-IA family hydrolase [Candidatus Omnitrophica bacterium]|nr:HAD-IA family hydrolase [Candidatus Omnitrophota bacterium]
MPSPSSIRAITFDAGGTLIDPWPSVGGIYADVAARFGYVVDTRALDRQFAVAWKTKANFDYSRRAWAEVVRQTFSGLTPHPPDNTLFEELYRQFAHAHAWRVYQDVRTTLTTLKSRGLRLGLISNWDERLRPLLTQLRLDAFFQSIVICSEIGAAKPSPLIFHRAVRQLDLPCSQVLHVGDSISEDVAGARAAGLQAVHLQRRRDASLPPGSAPAAKTSDVIQSLGELIE